MYGLSHLFEHAVAGKAKYKDAAEGHANMALSDGLAALVVSLDSLPDSPLEEAILETGVPFSSCVIEDVDWMETVSENPLLTRLSISED